MHCVVYVQTNLGFLSTSDVVWHGVYFAIYGEYEIPIQICTTGGY